MAYPTNYRYTKEHEWVDAKDGMAKIGITDYAQSELGDVVFVELPAMSIKSLTQRAKRLEWLRADRLRRRLAKISRWRMCHQHWLL